MKLLNQAAAAIVLSFSLSIPLAVPASANDYGGCQHSFREYEPSPETHTIDADGFSFEIPVNYRAELSTYGAIKVFDPSEWQFYQCLQSKGVTPMASTITVSRSPAVVGGASWPYDIPVFEWLFSPENRPEYFYHVNNSQQDVSIIYTTDPLGGMYATTFVDVLINSSSGGSIHVSSVTPYGVTIATIMNSIREN